MCYAIPGKVEALEGNIALVDYFGQKKKAVNELVSLAAGDYVFAQGGYVIQKVGALEAQGILDSWREMFVSLQEVDEELARFSLAGEGTNPSVRRILDRACQGIALSDPEYLQLLELTQPEDAGLFLKAANFLRQKYHQNACCTHGIIEISNCCLRNCAYCGISTHNKELLRYRMSPDEIYAAVNEAVVGHGFKAIVLQSGEDAGFSIGELAEMIREIKRRHAVLVLISFGELSTEGLQELYLAGARGLLMRFESSNPGLYAKLHPGYTLQSRLACLRKAYALGYLIITGSLIGIPGQTPQDVLNDIKLTRDLNAEMYSFGPFLPHPHTPLAGSPVTRNADMLKVLALARCVGSSDAKIVVTTAFETLSGSARREGLSSGANSLMLNITPLDFRKHYAIYPARAHEQDPIAAQVQEATLLLKSLGRVPVDLGISLNN